MQIQCFEKSASFTSFYHVNRANVFPAVGVGYRTRIHMNNFNPFLVCLNWNLMCAIIRDLH